MTSHPYWARSKVEVEMQLAATMASFKRVMRRCFSYLLPLTLAVSTLSAISITPANAVDLAATDCPTIQVNRTADVTYGRFASFCLVKFTSGANSFTPPTGVQSVTLLIVGGGGAGGGGGWSGGGGAGSVLYGTNYSVTPGTSYATSVGAGGAAVTTTAGAGNDGLSSSFGSITASGGGGGAGYGWSQTYLANGRSGGSGGGAAEENAQIATGGAYVQTDYANITEYGNRGGNQGNNSGSQAGSGGGGAGGIGGDVPSSSSASNRQPGSGGAGLQFSSGLGTVFEVGGGGGGASSGTRGLGGTYGANRLGGNGAQDNDRTNIDAVANTGSGGGGSQTSSMTSGAGGSGIVVVAFAYDITYNANNATGGTVPNNQIQGFNASTVLRSNSGTLVRTGYTFAGWNTQADGFGTSYLTGATYSINSSLNLYAQWTLNTCSGTSTTSSGGYTYVAFKTAGICSYTAPANVTAIDLLVVAGGGGGASRHAGGGGAGGLINSTSSVNGSAITITVGAGGAGGAAQSTGGTNASNGESSAISGGGISTRTGIGGGGGGYGGGAGSSGGSGGGGGNGGAGGSGSQGNPGSAGLSDNSNYWVGGGGGGAGGAATASTSTKAGSGGAGLEISWIPTAIGSTLGVGTTGTTGRVFAGGGGGGTDRNTVAGGNGGTGGGAAGSTGTAVAASETANTGGGGGGSGISGVNNGSLKGGDGGSGVVVIRYANTYTVTYSYNGADGGNGNTSNSFATGSTAITLPTPTKTNFIFDGWYEAQDLTGNALGSTYSPTQSLTIYAKWIPVLTGSVSITGNSALNSIQTANISAVTRSGTPAISYQWSSSKSSGGSFTNISGATTSTYTPASSTISYLKVAVTFTYSIAANATTLVSAAKDVSLLVDLNSSDTGVTAPSTTTWSPSSGTTPIGTFSGTGSTSMFNSADRSITADHYGTKYVTVTNGTQAANDALNVTGDITVEAQIYIPSYKSGNDGVWNIVATKWFPGSASLDWHFSVKAVNDTPTISTARRLNLYTNNGTVANGGASNVFGTLNVTAGAWHTVGFKLTSGALTFYLDGVADAIGGNYTRPAFPTLASDASNLYVGDYRTGAVGLGIDGKISRFRMFSKAITNTEALVPPTTQTITRTSTSPVSPVKSGTYTPTATSSSSLTVAITIASGSSSVCSISAGVVTFNTVGSCVIQYDQSGNSSYSAASQVTETLTIGKATPSLSLFANVSKNFGDSTFTVSAPTVAGSLAGTFTYSSATTSVISISSATATVAGGGTSLITATFTPTDSTNYNNATITMTVTVNTATQTVTWAPTTALATTASPATPSSVATALGSAVISYAVTSAGTTGCTVNSSTGVLTFTAAGSCEVTATAAATANYATANRAVTFVISLATRTLTINAGSFTSSYTMIATPPTITSTASAGTSDGTKSYASTTASVCTVNSSSGLVAFVSAGTCTLNATISAGTTYAAATSANISFTTTLATQTITFASLSNKTLGSGTYVISATASSLLAVTLTSATTGVCTIASDTITLVAAGTCTINANQAGDNNYSAAAQIPQSFTVATTLSITTPSGASLQGTYNTAFTSLTISSSGGAGTKTFTATGSLPAGVTLSSAGVISGTPTTAGDVSLTVTVTDANGVSATTSSFTISIAKGTSTVSLSAPAYTYTGSGQGPDSVTKTGSTGSVSYTYVGRLSTTYVSSSTKPTNAGTYTVTATLAADTIYATVSASADFTISNASLVITPTISAASMPYGTNAGSLPTIGHTKSVVVTLDTNPTCALYLATDTGYATVKTLSSTLAVGSYVVNCKNAVLANYTITYGSNAAFSVTKLDIAQASAPNVSATAGVLKSIAVSWTAVTNATSYSLKMYATDGTTLLATLSVSSGTSKTVTASDYSSIADGTNYKFTVIAIGDATYNDSLASSLSGAVTTNSSYTITYSYDSATGGASTANETLISGATALTLPVPTKSGYTFGGWFEASGLTGSALALTYSPTQTRNIYAKWNQIVSGSLVFAANSTSYLTIPNSANLKFGTGDFTVEWWQYQTDSTLYPRVFEALSGGTREIGVSIESNTFYWWRGGAALCRTNVGNIKSAWQHFAVSRVSGSTTVFFNGSVLCNFSDTKDYQPLGVLKIGAENGTGTNTHFGGNITNFHWVKGTGLYSAAFTPSDSPVTLVANSKILLNAENEATLITDLTGLNSVTNNANAVTWSTMSPFASKVVTFNANDGSGTPATSTQSMTSGTSTPLTANAFTRTGYTFAGWTAAADGSGTSYTNSQSVTITSRITIYAKWTPNFLTVTYSSQSGSAVASGSVNTGASILAAPTAPTRSGYTLSGWSATSTGSVVTFPYAHGQTAGFTLYAIWSANALTVTYDSQGGSAVTSGSVNTGANISAAPTAPTKAGHTLSGWSTTSTGSVITFPYTHAQTANFTLYAIWSANGLTVTYDSQGGSTVTSGSVNTGANILTAPTAPTRSGYTLSGWSTTSTGSTVTFPYTHAQTANFTLYAIWSANALTITYNSQGGSAVTSGSVNTDANILVAPTAPTRLGYTFSGWSATSTGLVITFPHTHAQTANFTLFAIWSANANTVVFNSNTGSGTMADQSITTAVATALTTNAFTKTGYTFAGWNTNADGTTGTTYANGQSVTLTAGMTVYAKWTINVYAIAFDTNGGSGTMGTQLMTHGVATNLNASLYSRANYVFYRWATAADGTGTTYNNLAQVTLTSGTTLYAQWTANTYVVTYNYNGGDGGDSTASASFTTAGSAIVLPTPTKTGFTFAGWHSDAALVNPIGSGVGTGNYSPTGATLSLNAYAKWTAINYTFTYNLNNADTGSVPTETSKQITQTATIKANTGSLVRAGYTFGGWNTLDNGTGTNYLSGALFTVASSNVILYAKWTPVTYTVTYNSNNGTGSAQRSSANVASDSYTTGGSFVVMPDVGTLARSGYTFGGWNTSAAGTGTPYSAAASNYSTVSNVILYAKWNPVTYSITYNENTGTGSAPTTGGYTTGQALPYVVLANTFTKTAGVFGGWNTAANGLGTSYSPGATITTLADIILYAVWIPQYTLYYAINGGTVNAGATLPGGTLYTVNTSVGPVFSSLSRTGYTFDGWTNGASTISHGGNFTILADSVLTAKWTAINYTISYNSDGGTEAPGATTRQIGQSYPVGTAVSKPGYNFAGWSNSSTVVGADAVIVMGSSNVNFTAQWVARVYQVSYDWTGGRGTAVSDVSYTFGTTAITLPLVGDRVRDGYTFAGWSESSNGSALAATYIPSQSRTLYALWTLGNFTVTYNLAGGTLTTTSVPVQNGGSTVLPLPTRTNFVFNGWHTAPSGGTSLGLNGISFTPSTSQTVYARWIQSSLFGIVDSLSRIGSVLVADNVSNTFSGANSNSSVAVSIPANALPAGTTVNFDLVGNSSRATGLLPGVAYLVSIAISWLTADGFVPDTTTGNPISVTISNATIKAGAAAYAIVNNVSTLLGTASQDGTITISLTSDPEIVVAATKSTAPTSVAATSNGSQQSIISWTAPTSNGGAEITGYTATSNTGATCTTASTSCTISSLANGTGYTFTVTATNSVGVSPTSTSASATTASLYSVTFDAKGGSTVANGSFLTSSTVSEPTAPIRAGYSFAGWAATDGGAIEAFPYAPGVTNNITMYARWDAQENAVTFDSKSGSSVASSVFASGGTVSEPAAPTRSGYTFAGWSATDGGSVITFPYSPSVVTDITLFAKWTAVTTGGGNSSGGGSGGSISSPGDSGPSVPVKSNVTIAAPVTVVGDKDAKVLTIDVFVPATGSDGKPSGLKIDAESEKFIASVKVVEGKLVLTPETGFSGKKTVNVTITENGADRIIQIPLTVLPEAVTKPVLTPTASNRTNIRWTESPNATAYTVLLNGKRVCTTSASNCSVKQVLGPDAVIEVISNGGDRTVSEKIEADFRQNNPVAITRLVSATITKATLTRVDTKALDKVIGLIRTQGFGTIVISEITTTKKTETLAAARIVAIKKYIDDKTGSRQINFEVVPAASRTYFNNISVKG